MAAKSATISDKLRRVPRKDADVVISLAWQVSFIAGICDEMLQHGFKYRQIALTFVFVQEGTLAKAPKCLIISEQIALGVML